jgi:Fe-S cluster assembly iron-binding protein IscA
MTAMLTVTERAKATLARLKVQADIMDDDIGLRLLLAGSQDPGEGQFGLRADRKGWGDQVVEYGGGTVLLVEEGLAGALGDATIDTDPTGPADELIITRSEERALDGPDEEARPW